MTWHSAAAACALVAGMAARPAAQLPGLGPAPEVEEVEVQTADGRVPATRIAAAHVTVVTYAGRSVRPGSSSPSGTGTVSLFVEITPEPGTHVYAKGAAGYQPVTVTVKTGGGIRLQGEPSYPPFVLHRFEALNEIVPVYEQAFRVSQAVRVPGAGPGPRRQPLVVEGGLLYQACTDSICYETEQVPLRWRVAAR